MKRKGRPSSWLHEIFQRHDLAVLDGDDSAAGQGVKPPFFLPTVWTHIREGVLVSLPDGGCSRAAGTSAIHAEPLS